MKLKQNPAVQETFNSYPGAISEKMMSLRQLIIDVAFEAEDIDCLEETLKWGEPSYLVNGGSTVRIGWKSARPEEYAVYFNCNTKLVSTFKEIYRDTFSFEGNRAIVFQAKDKLPIAELEHCVALAFSYHKIKHLPLLGE